MNVASLTQVLNVAALAALMFSTGLSARIGLIIGSLRRGRLMVGAAAVNFVLVPLVTVALLRLLGASPLVSLGFLVLAVCPGAPIGPPFTALARGNVAVATSGMVLLSGLSAPLAPVLLGLLVGRLAPESDLRVDAWAIARTLLLSQLVPGLLGLGAQALAPRWSEAWARPLRRLANGLLLALVVLIVAVQHESLAEIRLRGWLGMGLLLVLSLASGWLVGGRDRSDRGALAITGASRNVAVALVIVSNRFAGTAAVTAVVAYGLFSILGTLAFASVLGRMTDGSGARRTSPP